MFGRGQTRTRTVVSLLVGCVLFISEGVNYSLLAPFFPNEAEQRKGLTEFQVGVINSCFDAANILFTFVLAAVAKPELNKFFFLWGATFGAVSNICFGILAHSPGGWCYFAMCLSCRVVMGIGASMLWSTGVPLLTSLSVEHSGKITSLTESGVGVGFAIGPPIGSVIYALGGYMYPFMLCGLMELLLLFVAAVSIPSSNVIKEEAARKSTGSQSSRNSCSHQHAEQSSSDERLLHEADETVAPTNVHSDDVSLLPAVTSSCSAGAAEHNSDSSAAFSRFISIPGVWCISLFFLMASVPFGLFDVALGPYLLDTFGVDGDTSGFYFLSMGALYAVMTQVVGSAVDKGYGCYAFFWSCNASCIAMLLFALPMFIPAIEKKAFITIALGLDGIALSGTFVPIYVIMEQIAVKSGFSHSLDSVKLYIGILLNLVMSVGKVAGSVIFGGVVYGKLDFYWTMLITAFCFIGGTLLSNGYLLLSKNYRKMYYHTEASAVEPDSESANNRSA